MNKDFNIKYFTSFSIVVCIILLVMFQVCLTISLRPVHENLNKTEESLDRLENRLDESFTKMGRDIETLKGHVSLIMQGIEERTIIREKDS